MKTKIVVLGAALSFLLTACGNGTASDFKFEAGTYSLTNVQVASGSSDECTLLATLSDPDERVEISVSGSTVMFNPGAPPSASAAANTMPTATLDANTLTTATTADYTSNFGDNCVLGIQRSVTGTVTADDKADVTLNAHLDTSSGDCSPPTSPFPTLPCTSAYSFGLTKAAQ